MMEKRRVTCPMCGVFMEIVGTPMPDGAFLVCLEHQCSSGLQLSYSCVDRGLSKAIRALEPRMTGPVASLLGAVTMAIHMGEATHKSLRKLMADVESAVPYTELVEDEEQPSKKGE